MEFGIDRGEATLPYTATMIGFAVGGVLMGRFSDRFHATLSRELEVEIATGH